ncbi:protein of unknown function [Candidatus Methylocalor cossyra]|uniref:Uncharacterized protein n=1 Tax=Candidatus Methylocalor cossyra TaxID=3108543 RepID=A0ABM9NF97_9GAMM
MERPTGEKITRRMGHTPALVARSSFGLVLHRPLGGRGIALRRRGPHVRHVVTGMPATPGAATALTGTRATPAGCGADSLPLAEADGAAGGLGDVLRRQAA